MDYRLKTDPKTATVGDNVQVVLEPKAYGAYFTAGSTITFAGTYVVQPSDLSTVSSINLYLQTDPHTEYNGQPITPISFMFLKEGIDYTIEYFDNVNAGTARYVIQGIGENIGRRPGTFQITPRKLESDSTDISVTVADQDYTGAQIKPAVSVQDKGLVGEPVLVEGKDYTVEYGPNLRGSGTVVVTGRGNYTTAVGKEISANFVINGSPQGLIGDANNDGVVNARDATRISRYSIGSIEHFPIEDISISEGA